MSGVHSQRPETKKNFNEERNKQVGGGKDKFVYLSAAEDPVFETACKMDTNMTHGSLDLMSTKVHVDINSAEPDGDGCQCNTFIVLSK